MVLLCSLKSLCLSPLLMRCHASFWNRCVLWISYGILYICCCIHRCAGACLGVVLWLHQPQICIVRVMWLFRPPSINQYCNCRYSLYSLFSNANLLSSYPASSIHSSSCCLHQSPITLSAAMKLETWWAPKKGHCFFVPPTCCHLPPHSSNVALPWPAASWICNLGSSFKTVLQPLHFILHDDWSQPLLAFSFNCNSAFK